MAVAYLANPGRRQATELADKPGRHHQIKGVLREAVFSVWTFFSCGIPQGGCAIRMICFEITITYISEKKHMLQKTVFCHVRLFDFWDAIFYLQFVFWGWYNLPFFGFGFCFICGLWSEKKTKEKHLIQAPESTDKALSPHQSPQFPRRWNLQYWPRSARLC